MLSRGILGLLWQDLVVGLQTYQHCLMSLSYLTAPYFQNMLAMVVKIHDDDGEDDKNTTTLFKQNGI
jgi:hypothetical protein